MLINDKILTNSKYTNIYEGQQQTHCIIYKHVKQNNKMYSPFSF